MKRRDFIRLFGGTVAAPVLFPRAVDAQQPATPVIGFLNIVSPGPFAGELATFKKGLAEAGFVEGQNVNIEYRWANNEINRLPELAADLVRRNVTVIVAGGGGPAALVVKAATSRIPFLFTGASDPVKLGLVQSMNRPGGNATGVSFVVIALVAKRAELLRELLPQAKIVAQLWSGNDPDETKFLNEAGPVLGFQVRTFTARTNRELEIAFGGIKEFRADAVVIGAGPSFVSWRAQIVALAERHAIPAVYARREYVADGGLISYSPPVTESYRQVGVYAGRHQGRQAGRASCRAADQV